MPIRRLTIHACAYGVMLACCTQVVADVSLWNGSFAAQGTCYCTGEQSRNIDLQIVPTPVGGQSVAQVCERVGNGPTLQKSNGKFNFTVYSDAQCGNGPFPEVSTNIDKQCIGHLGVEGEDCAPRGPRWDLANAYAKDAKKSEVNSNNSIVTGGSRYIKPPVKQVSSKNVKSASKNVKPASKNVKKSPVENTSIAEIARTRSSSKKITKRASKRTVPQTREQIRARQLVQLAAARERARLAEAAPSSSTNESLNGLSPNAAPGSVGAIKIEPEVGTDQAQLKQLDPSKDARSNNAPVETTQAIPTRPEVSKKASVESVTEITKKPAVTKEAPPTVAALKFPPELGFHDPDFNYVEAAPISYDFGGAGLSVEASKASHNHMQYILSAAAADTYREAAIGVGMFFKPAEAERITFMARVGLEYGLFNFQNSAVTADLSDTGVFAGLATNVALNRQFKLQAGVGYSSFFEGDFVGFAAAFYHLTSRLDLTAKAEAGDNDLLGFGIRYHY